MLILLKLPNYAKIKQTFDLANAILRGGLDFEDSKKDVVLGKISGSNLIFRSDKSRRDKYLKDVEFFDVENKNEKTYIFTQHTKSLKTEVLNF